MHGVAVDGHRAHAVEPAEDLGGPRRVVDGERSPPPPPATRSSTVPLGDDRPWCMTTTWVQVCSTSASRWLDTSTVRPVAA